MLRNGTPATTLEAREAAIAAATGRYDTSAKEAGYDPDANLPIAEPIPQARPKAKHPDYLVRQAQEFGFSEAEINAVDSERLGQELYDIQRSVRAQQREESRGRAIQQAIAPAPAALDDDDDIPDLGEDVHEAIRGAFGKMKEKVKASKGLEKKIAELEAKENTRIQQSWFDTLDNGFAAVTSPLIGGDAAGSELRPDSAEFKRRKAILAAAGLDQVNGSNIPSARVVARKIKQAFTDLFGEVVAMGAQPAPNRPAPSANPYDRQPEPSSRTEDRPRGSDGRFLPTQQDYNEAALHRPTHRAPAGGGGEQTREPALTADDRYRNAVNAVRAKRQQEGYFDEE